MDKLLIFDTSTPYFSICLYDLTEDTYIEKIESEKLQHARYITTALDSLLKKSDSDPNDIKAIALNSGPGSFTGLRVGSSTAKGLCYGLDTPLISLEGLKDYAHYFYNKKQKNKKDIITMIDARNEHYFCSYTVEGIPQPIEKKSISEIDSIIHQYNIEDVYSERSLFSHQLISAAKSKYLKNETENICTFEPSYLINNYKKKK